ncbi:MAG: hypothetical protein WC967_09445 [Balneolaceae bacterium]
MAYILTNEEGSALITVLLITLILSLFIGSVLGGLYVQSQFIQQDINHTKALYKAEEGAMRYLSDQQGKEQLGISDSTTIVLADSSTVQIQRTLFGGYWLLRSSATVGKQQVQVAQLVGEVPDSIFNYAVALKDSTSSLNLILQTTLKGNVLLGREGIRSSNFKGDPFRGTFDGEVINTTMSQAFPLFDTLSVEQQLHSYETLFKGNQLQRFPEPNPSVLNTLSESDTLFSSSSYEWELNEATKIPPNAVLFVNGNLYIRGEGKLGDFTQLVVKDTLVVDANIKGNHLLLYAGKRIEVRGESEMMAQLLTKGRVELSGRTYLRYPSGIYSSSSTFSGEQEEVIHLKDQTIVDGYVMFASEVNSFSQNQYRIRIEDEAIVRGSVYTQGQTELSGTVYGSVLTNQFFFYESPTNYINWLKNVVIDRKQRPAEYVVPIGFSDSTKFKVLDWRLVE